MTTEDANPTASGDLSDLPLLSRQASELLRMTEESRQNVRLLALLAMQDPVAVARLLSLANSASMAFGRVIADLEVALTRVGSQIAYDILLKSALLNLLVSKTHPKELDALSRHIFSVGITAKKIANAVAMPVINLPRLVLLSSVEKLGLAWLLSAEQADEAALSALGAAFGSKHHLFRNTPALTPWVARSEDIARHWTMPDFTLSDLNAMSSPGAALQPDALSYEACTVLLAEQYLELAEAGLEEVAPMEALEARLQLTPSRTPRKSLVWMSA